MTGLTGNKKASTNHNEDGSYLGPRDRRAPTDHRTPIEFFEGASELWGPFELDSAASNENHLCEKYFTEEDNALFQTWSNITWCNPPYHDLQNWIDCAILQVQRGNSKTIVMLVPSNRCDQKWFSKAWVNSSFIGFIEKRLNFTGPHEISNSPFGSMIFVFGESKFNGVYFLNRKCELIRKG